MRKITFLLFLLTLTSCNTFLKVSDKQQDGYFYSTKKAKTIVNKSFDIDANKTLLLVPNGAFIKGMAEKIKYFDRVITFEELEKEIIQNGKQDEVGAITGKIGINNAYRKYKKFLYLRFDDYSENNERIQLKLINPETFDDIFVADTEYDVIWSGVTDQNTFYPLFNSLIDYIKVHSKFYK